MGADRSVHLIHNVPPLLNGEVAESSNHDVKPPAALAVPLAGSSRFLDLFLSLLFLFGPFSLWSLFLFSEAVFQVAFVKGFQAFLCARHIIGITRHVAIHPVFVALLT